MMKICSLIPRIFGLFVGLIVVLVINAVAFAEPSSMQPPLSGLTAPISVPDLQMIAVDLQNTTNPGASPSSGDEVRIVCRYYVCGCYQNKLFSNRIDVDGAIFYEKQGEWVPTSTTNPQMCSTAYCASYAWPPADEDEDTWKVTSGGHTIRCILDSKNDIAEGSVKENNNTMSRTVFLPIQDGIRDMKRKEPTPVSIPKRR